MVHCPQPPTDNVKAALRQLHGKFTATEDALEALCKIHQVQYHAPTIDEAGRAKTTERRRMMMSVLIPLMSDELLLDISTIRQEHPLFIAAEKRFEKRCRLTYNTHVYKKVDYEPPPPIEMENGTMARRKRMRRKLDKFDAYEKACSEMNITIDQRDDFMIKVEQLKREISLKSDDMEEAIEAFNKVQEKNKKLTFNDPYPGKPAIHVGHCPCQFESHGYLTIYRAFKLHFHAMEDRDLRGEKREERTDELLLRWGICNDCLLPYKGFLGNMVLWFVGFFAGPSGKVFEPRPWPTNLFRYMSILLSAKKDNLTYKEFCAKFYANWNSHAPGRKSRSIFYECQLLRLHAGDKTFERSPMSTGIPIPVQKKIKAAADQSMKNTKDYNLLSEADKALQLCSKVTSSNNDRRGMATEIMKNDDKVRGPTVKEHKDDDEEDCDLSPFDADEMAACRWRGGWGTVLQPQKLKIDDDDAAAAATTTTGGEGETLSGKKRIRKSTEEGSDELSDEEDLLGLYANESIEGSGDE